MSAPLAVARVPRAEMPAEYDQRTLEQAFQALENELVKTFKRDRDLSLEPGKKLILTSKTTNVQYAITLNSSGELVLIDYLTGTESTFVLHMDRVDGLATALADIQTAYESADASNAAAIAINASAISTNESAIASLTTEITAARDGEASLLAKITTVETTAVDADTAAATAQSEITAARDGEASLLAKIQSVETAYAGADTAIAGSVTTLAARVTTNEGDISTNAAALTTEASARASGDSANASSITTLQARVSNAGPVLNPNPFFSYSSTTPGAPFGWFAFNASALQTVDEVKAGVTVGKVLYYLAAASIDTGPYVTVNVTGGKKHRLRFESALVSGTYTTSAIVVAWSTGTGGYTFNLASTSPIDGTASAAPSGRQVWEFELDAPSGATTCTIYALMHWQGGYGTAASPPEGYIYELSLKQIGLVEAQVTNIAEAYATDNASTARLVWKVTTATNAATIEQTAAEGYADGTWNGSAISLAANLIRLLAQDIDFGTNASYEDTYGTFIFTDTSTSTRLRVGLPFGSSGDLCFWKGPTSVALNSETINNGVVAISDSEIKFGGTPANPLSGATVSPSYDLDLAFGSYSGTCGPFTITPQGGDGTYTRTTEKVALLAGSDDFTITNGTTSTPSVTWNSGGAPGTGKLLLRHTVTETSTGRKASVDFVAEYSDTGPP